MCEIKRKLDSWDVKVPLRNRAWVLLSIRLISIRHLLPFIQQAFTEHLLCARLCSSHWDYSSEQEE